MRLHEILTYYRKSNRISFDTLAERTSIPKSTLQKVFTGVTADPGFEVVRRIAYGLGITVDMISAAAYNTSGLTPEALETAQKYDQLDTHGQHVVCLVLDAELSRISQYGRINVPALGAPSVDELERNAASMHASAAGADDAAALD